MRERGLNPILIVELFSGMTCYGTKSPFIINTNLSIINWINILSLIEHACYLQKNFEYALIIYKYHLYMNE